jgi:hypothetical protein
VLELAVHPHAADLHRIRGGHVDGRYRQGAGGDRVEPFAKGLPLRLSLPPPLSLPFPPPCQSLLVLLLPLLLRLRLRRWLLLRPPPTPLPMPLPPTALSPMLPLPVHQSRC